VIAGINAQPCETQSARRNSRLDIHVTGVAQRCVTAFAVLDARLYYKMKFLFC
jgi:hypothetical protein